MSELRPYLGIEDGRKSLTIDADYLRLNELIGKLGQFFSPNEISGTHRVPCVISGEENSSVVHPILGAAGKNYGGFEYTDCKLSIAGERIPHGSKWDFTKPRGHDDELKIRIESADDHLVGIPAYRPPEISEEDEALVGEELSKSTGYVALHLDFGPTIDNRHHLRKLALSGENKAGELEELPFITKAASVITEQTAFVLIKDLNKR